MGFTAGTALPRLDWDFNPFVSARGVTPEPSRKMIDAFREGVRALDDERLELTSSGRAKEVDLDDDTKARLKELDYDLAGVIADLTAGRPSRDQLVQLVDESPRAFYGYLQSLMKDLSNPEG